MFHNYSIFQSSKFGKNQLKKRAYQNMLKILVHGKSKMVLKQSMSVIDLAIHGY